MRKVQLTALSAAVLAASAQASVDSFIDDSSLQLEYKNYYWNEHANTGKLHEWTQALEARFQSGWIHDMIGLNLTAGAAHLIDNGADRVSNIAADEDTLAGIQEAYIKFRLGDESQGVFANAGQRVRSYSTYSDSGSRILDSSTYGIDGTVNFRNLELYGAYITEQSVRYDDYFKEELTNANGEQIDAVQIVGGRYEFDNGLGFEGELSESTDYLKMAFFKTDYTVAIQEGVSLDLDARYGSVKSNGDLYGANNSAGQFVQNEDYESSFHNLNATINVGNAYFGIGYNQTRDGDYEIYHFDSDHGAMGSSLFLWEAFALEDETAYIVKAGYDFADIIPGLTWDVWYAQGSDAKDMEGFERSEFGSMLAYNFSGNLDGLSVGWLHATYRAEGEAVGDRAASPTLYTGNGTGTIYNTDSNRLYLNYVFDAF